MLLYSSIDLDKWNNGYFHCITKTFDPCHIIHYCIGNCCRRRAKSITCFKRSLRGYSRIFVSSPTTIPTGNTIVRQHFTISYYILYHDKNAIELYLTLIMFYFRHWTRYLLRKTQQSYFLYQSILYLISWRIKTIKMRNKIKT